MPQLTRRRFIAISAVGLGLAAAPVRAEGLYEWRGVALGAAASIRLRHPDAAAIAARAAAEIARLDGIFSLFRADSALMQVNAAGTLAAPPFELLECLALAAGVHQASGGLFDPTVQPLWALYASRFAAGGPPSDAEIAATLPHIGWDRVEYDSAAVRLQPGMALTLNGIAQGFIADKVADLLRAEGLTDILVDTGELRALGGNPMGGDWPVRLTTGGQVALRDRSLASSSALGTCFDAAGQVGHILDPRLGRPAPARWQLVSIGAQQAGLADALSTAACLMPDRATIETALAVFPGARIEALS